MNQVIFLERQAIMENLKLVRGGGGLGPEHAATARIYVIPFQDDCSAMNANFIQYSSSDRRPARACVGVTGP